ncbi:MAG: YggS family pyridoxal phosphate-dependent enzyme [Firmicutes bacterium]|nr:YggS family pyridoxal phosphate-dependent enzyme [Bacillota bacterium]
MKFYTTEVLSQIPSNVTVIAATKYFDALEMKELFQSGITHFGENRVEALLEKKPLLEDYPIIWHYIGTLQTKKVKKVINEISYLHSLDNLSLAEEINKRRTTPLPCFIQVNISDEDSKHGLNISDVVLFIKSIAHYPNIQIIGLMGMAELTEDENIISKEFQKLNDLQITIEEQCNLKLVDLSIGMSNDYQIALKHHATFLRLGSVLFKKEVS